MRLAAPFFYDSYCNYILLSSSTDKPLFCDKLYITDKKSHFGFYLVSYWIYFCCDGYRLLSSKSNLLFNSAVWYPHYFFYSISIKQTLSRPDISGSRIDGFQLWALCILLLCSFRIADLFLSFSSIILWSFKQKLQFL